MGFSYCCFTSSFDDKTFRWSSSNFFKLVPDSVRIISRLILKSHRTLPLVDIPASWADKGKDKSELVVWQPLCFPLLHWTEPCALNSLHSPSSWKTASLPYSTYGKAARSTYNFVYWVNECQKKSTCSKGCCVYLPCSALAHFPCLEVLQKCFWVAGLHQLLPPHRQCTFQKGLGGSFNWLFCKFQS